MLTTAHHATSDEHLFGSGSGGLDSGDGTSRRHHWEVTGESVKASNSKEAKVVELLHESVRKGHIDMVTSLVQDSRVNPNMRDRKGWTPILRAAKSNQLEVLAFLLHVQADIKSETRQGNSALHKAAKCGLEEAAHMLIEAGAAVNQPNEGGATPLMMSVLRKGGEDVVKLLLNSEADVNVQKDVGYSALMLAARYNHVHEARILIRAGAEIEAQDRLGETALMKAQKHQKVEMIELLKEHGAIEHQRIAAQPHTHHHHHHSKDNSHASFRGSGGHHHASQHGHSRGGQHHGGSANGHGRGHGRNSTHGQTHGARRG